MLQTARAEKVDEKIWGYLYSFHVASRVMVFKLSKKAHFLRFCADFVSYFIQDKSKTTNMIISH